MTDLTISIFDYFPNENKINVLYAISSLSEYSKYILRKLFGEDFKNAKLTNSVLIEKNEKDLLLNQINNEIKQYIDFSCLTEKEKKTFNFDILPTLTSKINSNQLRIYTDSCNLDNLQTESRKEKAKLQRKSAYYFGFNNYLLVYNLIKKDPTKKRGLLDFKQLNNVIEQKKDEIWNELEKRKQNGVEIEMELSPLEIELLRILNLKVFSNYLIEDVIKIIKFSMLMSGITYSNRLSVLIDFVKNNFYLVTRIINSGLYLKYNISDEYFDDYYKLNHLMSQAYHDLLDDPEINIVEVQRNLHFYLTSSKELAMASLNVTLDEECEYVSRERK